MMTITEAKQLERATAIAFRDDLRVCGIGNRKSDGAAVYCVPSRSEPGRWHLVTVAGCGRLMCDCKAGRLGRVCAHRAAVHGYLIRTCPAANERTKNTTR